MVCLGGLPSARSRRFLDWEMRLEDLEKGLAAQERKARAGELLLEQLRDASAQRSCALEDFDARLSAQGSALQGRLEELGQGLRGVREAWEERAEEVQAMKVKVQQAQNALEQLDAGNFRRSLEEVAKRLEERFSGRMRKVSEETKRELELNRQSLEKAAGRCRSQLLGWI